MRNSIFINLWKDYFSWKSSELLRTLIRLVAYPFLSTTKLKTIFFICLAFKDAIFKMGKMNY